MTEIIQFLLQHWILSGTTVVLLVFLFLNEWFLQSSMKHQLSPQEVIQMINHHQAVVVDVRDQSSFEGAHVVGAIHIPEAQLENKLSLINNYKAKPLVLVCASGAVAPKLLSRLASAGFEQVYSLAGGMLAWQKEHLPLLKK